MAKNDYLFKNATIDELERLYMKFREQEDAAGMFTTEGKLYADSAEAVTHELSRRGERKRWAFLSLKKWLADTETESIVSLAKKIYAASIGEPDAFKDDFTEAGDPISEEGFLMGSLVAFLHIELEDRGFTRSEVIHAIYPEDEDYDTEEAV